MSDELVQRVADVISMVYESEGIIDVSRGVIALVRAETLEEAARVAESIKTVEIEGYAYQVDGPTQDTTAAAIRALKDKP